MLHFHQHFYLLIVGANTMREREREREHTFVLSVNIFDYCLSGLKPALHFLTPFSFRNHSGWFTNCFNRSANCFSWCAKHHDRCTKDGSLCASGALSQQRTLLRLQTMPLCLQGMALGAPSGALAEHFYSFLRKNISYYLTIERFLTSFGMTVVWQKGKAISGECPKSQQFSPSKMSFRM